MLDVFTYAFIQKALIACFFTSIICAVAGTLVVVNRSAYITGGVAHASYGGIGLALYGGFPPIAGAAALAALMGLLLGRVRQHDEARADAVVSGLWAAGMALGILLSDLTPGYAADFLAYLFGNILLVSTVDLVLLGVAAVSALLLTIKYYRILLACSADKEYAATLGVPVALVNTLMLVFLCVSVVMLMKVAGLILVMALLSIPASIAERHTKRMADTMIVSFIISAVAIFGGFFIAIQANLTPSAVIVGILATLYGGNAILHSK
jgi:zinc transport system permease protein